MKKFVFILFISLALTFVMPLFSGQHHCFFGVQDKGPGTVGCFYSASNVDVLYPNRPR